MQPVTYLNGLGNAQKGEQNLVVVEDENGQRFIIDTANMDRTEGLGFITDLIGAGVKIIGKLTKKKKPEAEPAAAAPAPQPQGFLPNMMNAFASNPAGNSTGNTNGGLLDTFKLQVKSLIDNSHGPLANKLQSLTQENKALTEKLTTLSTEQKQAEIMDQMKAQEAALKAQLQQELSLNKDDKTPLYIGMGIAGIALIMLMKSPGTNGLNGPVSSKTRSKTAPRNSRKSGKIKI